MPHLPALRADCPAFCAKMCVQFWDKLQLKSWIVHYQASEISKNSFTKTLPSLEQTAFLKGLFRRRLSAEGAKPESNNRWKSELGHVCMYVGGWVWYLELSREPRHVAQQTRYQNVGLGNRHCLHRHHIIGVRLLTSARRAKLPK